MAAANGKCNANVPLKSVDRMNAEKLTEKQKQFVAEYLTDLNATQAAIRVGYSEKTARQQGARLLTNVNVAAAISAGREKQLKTVGFSAEKLLEELVEEDQADLADIYNDDMTLKPMKDWPPVWRKGLVQGVDIEEIFTGTGENRKKIGEVRKVRLSDRVKRKELLGKHVQVQAFSERVEHDVSDPLKELMRAISGTAITPEEK